MKMHKNTLSSLGEFNVINLLTRSLPLDTSVVCGVGDDAAVLKSNGKTYTLLTTDFLLENIHFRRSLVTPEQIGHKALARSISDIAAMGGFPTHAVVALALPPRSSVTYVQKIYTGMRCLARRFGVSIVGGDTARADRIIMAITVLGRVQKEHLVQRSGARVGDCIVVTGTLGGSMMRKHMTFEPRVQEARYLTIRGHVHAMIDISDGFVQDLGHVCRMSRAGAMINKDAIPVSTDALKRSQTTGKNPVDMALYDGEDYELLCTMAPRQYERVRSRWRKKFSIPLTCVGHIVCGSQLMIRECPNKTNVKKVRAHGYNHFVV